MSEILKVKVQDENGNIFYIHTSADVVFCADGTSVQERIDQKIDKSSIVQNATTAAMDKIPSAAVAKDLQDQINKQNTKITNQHTPTLIKRADLYPATNNATEYTYHSIPGLSDWQEIEIYAVIGDATSLPIRVNRVTVNTGTAINISAYHTNNFYGSGRIHVDFDNNRIGLMCRNAVGWDHTFAPRVKTIWGIIKK